MSTLGVFDPKEVVSVDFSYLIADQPAPCSIIVYFKGKLIELLKKDQSIKLEQLTKLKVDFWNRGFILKREKIAWDNWVGTRHVQDKTVDLITDADSLKASGKAQKKANGLGPDVKTRGAIAHFLTYAEEAVVFKTKSADQEGRIQTAREILKISASNSMIAWFFSSSPDEMALKHNARVSWISLLFTCLALPTLPKEILESLTMAGIIHSFSQDPGDPKLENEVYNTLEELKADGRTLPQQVLMTLRDCDECFDGTGTPRGIAGSQIHLPSRIIQFANQFDHFRLKNMGGTRRVRFDRAKQLMTETKAKYDPRLWALFFQFIDSIEVID